jgi:hypothetical protein
MKRSYQKNFASLSDAIKGLVGVSHSSAQALSPNHGWGDTPEEIEQMTSLSLEEIVCHLDENQAHHEHSGQPGRIMMVSEDGKVSYRTSGGLHFSLSLEDRGVTVFLYHRGSHCPRESGVSSLEKSCLSGGFIPSQEVRFVLETYYEESHPPGPGPVLNGFDLEEIYRLYGLAIFAKETPWRERAEEIREEIREFIDAAPEETQQGLRTLLLG